MSASFIFWLLLKLPPSFLLMLEGCQIKRLRSAEQYALVNDFLQKGFPTSDWQNGLFNDVEQLFMLADKPDWPLEKIQAPTLVIHGERDQVVRFQSAQSHANRIPGAKLVPLVDGTHMSFATHLEEIRQAIGAFMIPTA